MKKHVYICIFTDIGEQKSESTYSNAHEVIKKCICTDPTSNKQF